MKPLLIVLALVAILWQESSASTCSYSCRKSYETSYKCGFWGWSRCKSTAYRTGTCYRTCTHGGYSSWSTTYGTCSQTCGGGIQRVTKKRYCTNPPPSGGGRPCAGSSYSYTTQTCNTQSCPVHGGWTEYKLSATGDCSTTCGGGEQILTFTRSCTDPSPMYGGNDCVGDTESTDTETCNEYPCPVNGGWTDFTEWEEINECDSLCGGGIKEEQRDRTCTNPTPAYGGDDCDGELSQVRNVTCNTELCGNKCPSGHVTYIAHNGNKNRFYQCDNDVARLRDCAVGTMWSQERTVCINLPVPTECNASNGLVADPDNCRNYRICDGGQYKTVSCGSGSAFNAAIKACDHELNVPDCN
ncbi:hemicentin-1 isoform X3 [Patella vulgata]|uniref:hemicentin-1 isoform X3 n=1 Tax=Patella vulgata TaxID=6465 RepID=UPI00217FC4E9|nr:hemicentin-1 isoform X3 [Patella vulgata]